MNYKKIYQDLINKAKASNRRKGVNVYYESHHILPKSFGGKGDCRNINHPNIVLLTSKEHYIAHLLLSVIYPDSPAMKKALWNMCNITNNRFKPSAKTYERIRNEYIISVTGSNNHFYGREHSKEAKEKIGNASKGRKTFLNKKHTEETKQKISVIKKGSIVSQETRQKISNKISGGNHYNAKKIICLKTDRVFGSGKELSDYLNIPFSTIRRWLNGTTKPPKNFCYKRM